MTKEEFTKLAKKHLFALENYPDRKGKITLSIYGIDKLYEAINYAQCSTQLNEDNHLFSKIKTLADLRELYPNQSGYRIQRDGGLLHYFVNEKKVFTKHLIV